MLYDHWGKTRFFLKIICAKTYIYTSALVQIFVDQTNQLSNTVYLKTNKHRSHFEWMWRYRARQ